MNCALQLCFCTAHATHADATDAPVHTWESDTVSRALTCLVPNAVLVEETKETWLRIYSSSLVDSYEVPAYDGTQICRFVFRQ